MGADQLFDWHDAAASALAWWSDAGVDTLVGDTPRNWLAASPTPPLSVERAPEARTSILPTTFDAFLDWRSGPDAPDAGWSGAAVRFEGPHEAALMVLLDCPDREDCMEGALLAGAPGRLFGRMLAAIGLERASIHLAAICARRPTAGRIPADAEASLTAAVRQHIALAAPERLLLMGGATSRAILGIDGVHARGISHGVNHPGGTVSAVVTHHPRFLIEKPAAKADAWRDLQLLKRGLA